MQSANVLTDVTTEHNTNKQSEEVLVANDEDEQHTNKQSQEVPMQLPILLLLLIMMRRTAGRLWKMKLITVLIPRSLKHKFGNGIINTSSSSAFLGPYIEEGCNG